MEYKHINFVYGRYSTLHSAPTEVWYCEAPSGDGLGEVYWFPPWREYCFYPDEDTVFYPDEDTDFSADCLAEIQDFLESAQSLRIPKGAEDDQD